jgi:GTPase SAR1 family protein
VTRSVYLLGGPGAGKSTLMSELLRGWTPGPYVRFTQREMFGHWLLNDELELSAYLGHLRPEYPGTDALSMSVAPHALSWLESLPRNVSRVFGEGTRLGHSGFLQALHVHTELTVVYLYASDDITAQRRSERPGKVLNETYVKMAAAKARNAAEACRSAGIRVLDLDASRTPQELAKEVLALG